MNTPFTPSTPTLKLEIAEDWLYFKQSVDEKWKLKYCICKSPFLFIYETEDLKRKGRPELVLIINENLNIYKKNDRIEWCGKAKVKKNFSYSNKYWTALTKDGYITIGKILSFDEKSMTYESISTKHSKFRRRSKKYKKPQSRRAVSFGNANDLNNMASSNNKMAVIATKERDKIEEIYKWDIAVIKLSHSGSSEVTIEEKKTKMKLAQLRFKTRQDAIDFTKCTRECVKNLKTNRQRFRDSHPDVTGTGKPLFPLMIVDEAYEDSFYFMCLNQSGVNKWFDVLQPKAIDDFIKPLISRLECADSSLVNLDEVHEIYDLISRDLGNSNDSTAAQQIINMPMDKRIQLLHMNAISASFQGVHYWIAVLMEPKEPINVLKIFQSHLDNQAVKKAKFIEQFVENDGLISLLSIQKKYRQEIIMSDGEKSHSELRILLAKVFETIISALPYNETIREDEATQQQKKRAKRSKQLRKKQFMNEHKKEESDNKENDNDDLNDVPQKIKQLFESSSDDDSSEDDDDDEEKKDNDDDDVKETEIGIDILTSPMSLSDTENTFEFQSDDERKEAIKSLNVQINGVSPPRIGTAIQIRYRPGAEVIFDSEEKEEVMEYLVTSIWGLHETEIVQNDLAPCIGIVKCLFTLCLTKPEFSSIITNILLEATDLGKENDNWWLPLVKTIENVLDMFKTADSIFGGTVSFYIVKDECKTFLLGLLTLILTMIDCFDIGDRITERKLLDAVQFDPLLYRLQEHIADPKLNGIIELYRRTKAEDGDEIMMAQMEMNQENIQYVIDRSIQCGCNEYFSNILQNFATFPDEAEDAWKNIDKYVNHWKNKFNPMQHGISDIDLELRYGAIEHGDDGIYVNMNGVSPDVDSPDDMKRMETDDVLNKLMADELEQSKSYLSVEQVEQMDMKNAFNERSQKLENEKSELNSKYQSQLSQNNDLQQLLKEYRDKIAELEDKMENLSSLKGGSGIGNGLGDGNGGGNGFAIVSGDGDGNGNGNGNGNGTGTGSGNGSGNGNGCDDGNGSGNGNGNGKGSGSGLGDGSGSGLGSGNGPGNGSAIYNGSGTGDKGAGGIMNGIQITEEDKKKLDTIKEKEKKEAEIKAKKAKIIKYKPAESPKIEQKSEKKEEPKPIVSGQLPPLSAEDEKIVQKFKKQLKVGLPASLVKNKMKAAKAEHLLAYVFPEVAAELLKAKKKALPELNEEDKGKLAKYERMKKVGLPPHVVKNKMKQAKVDHLIPYLYPPEPPKEKKKRVLPKGVKAKPKIKPNVDMLAFHWNKVDEKKVKDTIWYDVYKQFGKNKKNKIFELSKLDELFGKPEDKKKGKKVKKKKSNINLVPSEVSVLDKKTRQKVEIFLSRVRSNWKMSTKKVCDHILNMNENGLSHDHIEKLMTVAPTAKQVDDFQSSIKGLNDNDELAKGALFWQELLNVDVHIRDRLVLWNFKLNFKQLIEEEEQKVNLMEGCIKKIRNDDSFKRVLATALDIGNYVNGGKRQGQAFGFNIGTLEKLDQFPRRRNADGSPVPTMLEYIYKLFEEQDPNILNWTQNLQILDDAVTIDLNVINANVKKFETNINLLYDRLQSADEKQLSGKKFVHKMQPFYDRSVKQLSAFDSAVKLLNFQLNELGKWFDVDEGDNLELLKQINAFRKTFRSIGPRLIKRQKDMERKAKKANRMKKGKGRKKKARFIETTNVSQQNNTKHKPKPPVDGGVQIPGFSRRATILKAVANKTPLNLDASGNLVPSTSIGSRNGSALTATSLSRGASMSKSRRPSVNVHRGGLRSELMKFAASVNNKVPAV